MAVADAHDSIDPKDYYYEGGMSDQDFEYTWDSFRGVPELYERAARAGRAVMFVADL